MKILACLLPFSLVVTSQAAPYKDARYGFSIVPPAFAPGEAESVTPVMFFAAGEKGFAANLNVAVQTTSMTAQEYAELSRGQFQQMGLKVHSEKELKVGGRNAFLWDYQGKTQGLDLHWLALAVHDKGRVFLVTGTSTSEAFEKHEKAFRDALTSFTLPE
ncbi:MAG TPA: DcrB-related protein [Planctomycetota bacterium]